MTRLMFAKVEAWLVLLLALLCLLGTIAFGFVVLDGANGGKRFGAVSMAAVQIAETPLTLKNIANPPDRVRIWKSERYADKPTGWGANLPAMPEIDGYLLVSRYDGSVRRHKIELVSMRDWQVKYLWSPDGVELLDGAVSASPFIDFSTWNTSLFRAIHPLLLPNGDLIVKDHYSPLFGVDFCGRRKWLNDKKVFHHSTEADAEGFLWIPSLVEPQSVSRVPRDFAEDEILKVNTDGEVVFSRSVTQLMLDRGLDYLLFTNGSYVYDPTHLNDIEPVREDGPYWKRGDVFLSLRNISTIMLYRPSTDEIVWMKQGPWVAQHDVDVLDNHRISVYDNHAEDRGNGAFVEESSNVVIYDFATESLSRPFADLMLAEKIKTTYAGLYAALPGGYALIEDVTDARLIVASPDGKLAAEFINRAENGMVYQLGWSRYIEQSLGDRVLAAAKGVDCGG